MFETTHNLGFHLQFMNIRLNYIFLSIVFFFIKKKKTLKFVLILNHYVVVYIPNNFFIDQSGGFFVLCVGHNLGKKLDVLYQLKVHKIITSSCASVRNTKPGQE